MIRAKWYTKTAFWILFVAVNFYNLISVEGYPILIVLITGGVMFVSAKECEEMAIALKKNPDVGYWFGILGLIGWLVYWIYWRTKIKGNVKYFKQKKLDVRRKKH